MTIRYLGILAFLLSTLPFVTAQTGTIRGNVFDARTGEPIIYGNVRLEGTDIGTTTDANGFFAIANVEEGTYTLVTTYVGYDSTATEVEVRTNDIEYLRIEMEERGVDLEMVDVSARDARANNEVSVSRITLSPKRIKSLPSTGGEADLAQYLPVLPGIVFTGDQGGKLYIRGGSPIQNKILLDGMTIYNPFHSIGFFSVFETETIKTVDVLTGGFNAEYGGRISAIVDIKTRTGNQKRLSGLVSANPFQSKFLLEGPIKELNEDTGSAISFLLTGKHSYLQESSKLFYPYATEDDRGLPYNYTDFYGKVSFLAGNGSKLDVFGFDFNDNVDYAGVADLGWNAIGGGARFRLVPYNADMVIDGLASFSKYDIELQEADDAPRYSEIKGFNIKLDFTYFGQDSEFKYGFDIKGFRTDFQFRNFLGYDFQQFDNTTELGGYLQLRKQWGRFIFEPSARLQYYASLNDVSLEPRLGMKYNLTEFLRLKFAGGLYSQNLISTVNENDVVNLFVGFLSGPEETIYEPGSSTPTNTRLQKAWHGVAGVEMNVTPYLELNVEPYYKRFSQLINLNRHKLKATDPDFVTETGDAYGIDLSARYERGSYYFWATYSLGYVERDDGSQVYPTIFDRRHNINLLGTYSFGSDRDWEFSARWNLGSGFPFTKTQGFYGTYNFLKGLDVDYKTDNPDLKVIYSEDRNGGRLPYYHRLDLSLKKQFDLGNYSSLEAVVSVTNVYNRDNIFYFDRIRYERVDQLPILPSAGLTWKF